MYYACIVTCNSTFIEIIIQFKQKKLCMNNHFIYLYVYNPQLGDFNLCTPKLLERFKCKPRNENIERRNWGMLFSSQHFMGERGI